MGGKCYRLLPEKENTVYSIGSENKGLLQLMSFYLVDCKPSSVEGLDWKRTLEWDFEAQNHSCKWIHSGICEMVQVMNNHEQQQKKIPNWLTDSLVPNDDKWAFLINSC